MPPDIRGRGRHKRKMHLRRKQSSGLFARAVAQIAQGIPSFAQTAASRSVRSSRAVIRRLAGQPYAQRFVTNVPPDEKIDGIPVAEVAAYVRTGTVSYLSKFFRMDREKKKIGWNWAAFFFSPFWFFYRKLYAAGAVVTSLLLALSVAFSGPLEQYMEAYLQYAQAAMQGQAAAESALAALWGAMPLATLFLGLQLVLHVVCALIANRLYLKKTTGDLHALHEQTLGESEYRLQLFKKGGTSLLFGFSSYVLYDIAYMLVIQLLAQIL